jgi:basic membrane protein A
VTEDFIAEADIILLVAGPTGLEPSRRLRTQATEGVWVDDDGCTAIPDSCGVFLTSVLKNMDVSVRDDDRSSTGPAPSIFVGTLENDGVYAGYGRVDADPAGAWAAWSPGPASSTVRCR